MYVFHMLRLLLDYVFGCVYHARMRACAPEDLVLKNCYICYKWHFSLQ